MKLTDENKEALNRYGNLDELSIPEALYEAGKCMIHMNKTCCMQLMQHSAELLYPAANCWMGVEYKYGGTVEKDFNLALAHFRAASSRGNVSSMMELIAHCDHESNTENVLNYVRAISRTAQEWIDTILWDYYPVDYNFEHGELEQQLIRTSQSMCGLDQSYDHFFGICARKSRRKAVEVLPSFDFNSYSVRFDGDEPNGFYIRFCIHPHHYSWIYEAECLPIYLDFLFESNQFLPFFIWVSDTDMFLSREWKRRALHAANNHCLDAHIFLADYYSSNDHRNEREMKRHLRFAADAGHSHARFICRHLFGRKANMTRKVQLLEEKRNRDKGKERHRSCTKHSKESEGDSHKKGTTKRRKGAS